MGEGGQPSLQKTILRVSHTKDPTAKQGRTVIWAMINNLFGAIGYNN